MPDIRVVCPCCGVSLRVKPELAGSTIRCPKCVSLVPIKALDEEEFAQPVEASYEAIPLEEDNVGRLCPKCANSMKPGAKFCQQCGWHLYLETYFEDLKAENLIVRVVPRTKWETWFDGQMSESSRPGDVLTYSAIGGVILTIIFLAVAYLHLGLGGLLSFPLLVVAWICWYRAMQLIGLLYDPTRNRRLAKEQVKRPNAAAMSPATSAGTTAPVKTTLPGKNTGPVKSKAASSTGPLDFDLPDAELPGESKPKPKTAAAIPPRQVIRPGQPTGATTPAASTSGKSTPTARPAKSDPVPASIPKPKPTPPAPPATQPAAEKPQKPQAADDDWLSDLL